MSVEFKIQLLTAISMNMVFITGTPLHVAVKTHSRKINCSCTIAFLLSQGADVLAQVRMFISPI
jgi:hypothetical protein